MVIDIDFAKYIHNLLFLRLIYHQVKVFFIMKDGDVSNIQNISLITKDVILHNEARRRIAMASRYILPIHQFETLIQTIDTPSTTNKFHLTFDGFSQGLFINLPINKIKNISITINDKHQIISHTSHTLPMIATKISENVFFLPYIVNAQPLNLYDFKSYKNAISYSHFDKAELTIETTEPIELIQISSMNANMLSYISGMGGLMFYKIKEVKPKPAAEEAAVPPVQQEESKKEEVIDTESTQKTTTLRKRIFNLFT
jgi:hypothetical protein